jgi:hypothetical protein
LIILSHFYGNKPLWHWVVDVYLVPRWCETVSTSTPAITAHMVTRWRLEAVEAERLPVYAMIDCSMLVRSHQGRVFMAFLGFCFTITFSGCKGWKSRTQGKDSRKRIKGWEGMEGPEGPKGGFRRGMVDCIDQKIENPHSPTHPPSLFRARVSPSLSFRKPLSGIQSGFSASSHFIPFNLTRTSRPLSFLIFFRYRSLSPAPNTPRFLQSLCLSLFN